VGTTAGTLQRGRSREFALPTVHGTVEHTCLQNRGGHTRDDGACATGAGTERGGPVLRQGQDGNACRGGGERGRQDTTIANVWRGEGREMGCCRRLAAPHKPTHGHTCATVREKKGNDNNQQPPPEGVHRHDPQPVLTWSKNIHAAAVAGGYLNPSGYVRRGHSDG
jgi:hypothetical protein